jgi:UDP-glucuronate 4-epimerase
MNFLVTGGAGFIGSHVCERLLAAGHAVWALDDLNGFYDPALKRRNLAEIQALQKPFVFAQGDVADRTCLQQLFRAVSFDQVIHLAARAGIRPSLKEPALYQRVNVEGTANILETARASGVAKIILASSSSVYGINAKVPFSESDPVFAPISPYAASKLACEALGHVFHHVYGMDIVMLRFFTVYGPRQRPDLAIHKFARRIAAGLPIELFGDGSSARDYTYVTDIVDGVMACVHQTFGYEIFNLGGSNPATLSRLVQLLEEVLGRKALVERKPDQPGDVPQTWADLSKSGLRLGYSPKVRIEEGIPLFVDWFRRVAPDSLAGRS